MYLSVSIIGCGTLDRMFDRKTPNESQEHPSKSHQDSTPEIQQSRLKGP